MNTLELKLKELIQKSKNYLENGKHKLYFKIIVVSISVFAIFEAGKSLGEFIYFIKN